MPIDPIRVLIFGAHPDDADICAGGVAALYSQRGHTVQMVSLTNGDAGHHEQGGAPLAWRRRAEAAASGAVLGCDYITLDNHDGELVPSLEVRHQVIEIIRGFQPDLIMAPRPWDYHPDHRYTAQVVQDALYVVTVPNVLSHAQHLRRNPAAVYLYDSFQKPYPFIPDVIVAIDDVIERKLDALHCHVSQFYEWLPYNAGVADQVPEGDAERRAWLAQVRDARMRRVAERYRARLIERYGEARGGAVQYAEAFEICEYGAALDAAALERLFPF
ncbi:MAG: PIG-L family deacetylase [Anaerolineae bacterium]|nr:PIG-L family deacetylase [Anaerolineae bacterium]